MRTDDGETPEAGGPDGARSARRRIVVRGAALTLSVPAAVVLHYLLPGLPLYGPIALAGCGLLGVAVSAWWLPHTRPASASAATGIVPIAISVGVAVLTISLGPRFPFVYPLGVGALVGWWTVAAVSVRPSHS